MNILVENGNQNVSCRSIFGEHSYYTGCIHRSTNSFCHYLNALGINGLICRYALRYFYRALACNACRAYDNVFTNLC